MKCKVIDKQSRFFGQVGVQIGALSPNKIFLEFDNNVFQSFKYTQLQMLENIYMTPDEVSEKAKKYARMEQRILDWLDVESDKYVIEKLKNLING